MITTPAPALLWALGSLFACLVAGSVIRFVALRNAEAALRRQRFASLGTWWALAGVMSVGLLAGVPGICILLGIVSMLGWKEITGISAYRTVDRPAVLAGYLLIASNYLLILAGWGAAYVVFLPLVSGLVFAVLLLLTDVPQGYIRSTGGLLWGMLFLGYGLSHTAFLFTIPAAAAGPLGAAGWFLFLVILTEFNDICQALVGRAFGAHKKHRIAPVISPNKTVEGFLGGMLLTVALSVLIAPWLTTFGQAPGPFGLDESLRALVGPGLIAVLICLAGYFGDINMSAIKRDSGVKDGSKLLPGMGGIIDRFDSLTMSAPVFVYFLPWWLA